MKKILSFVLGSFMVLAVSAQSRVILNVDNDYEVKIDGRTYTGNNETITNISQGTHGVEVYRISPGLLGIGKKRTLVSSSNFQLGNNDVTLLVDNNGQLRINQSGSVRSRNRDRDRDGNVFTRDNDDNDNRKYKKSKKAKRNNGNKYGHYKNGKRS